MSTEDGRHCGTCAENEKHGPCEKECSGGQDFTGWVLRTGDGVVPIDKGSAEWGRGYQQGWDAGVAAQDGKLATLADDNSSLSVRLELAQHDHDRCCVKMNDAVLRAEKAERERDSFQRCEVEASKEALELRDTLSRIATSFTAQHKDSGKCDDIGEIYHLLRECGALKEADD